MSASRKWFIRLVRFGMYLATALTALLTLFIVPAVYDIFLKKDPKKVVIEEVEE